LLAESLQRAGTVPQTGESAAESAPLTTHIHVRVAQKQRSHWIPVGRGDSEGA